MKLEWIKARELSLEEIADLIKGAKTCTWDYMSVEELIEADKENSVYFYRISGEASGILVARPNWSMRRLEILLIVGRGYARWMPEIRGEVAMAAKGLGFDSIAGWVSKRTHMAAYERCTSAKPVATLYVETV